jgi:hypothetical protein
VSHGDIVVIGVYHGLPLWLCGNVEKMSWGNVDEAVSFKKENNGVRSVSSNWWLFF